MSVLDNAQQHFVDLVNGDSRQSVEVDEWQTTIYFTPLMAMNGQQYQKYIKAAQKGDYEAMVDLLILRARDESGLKMFKSTDRKDLMYKVSPQVVTDIVGRMADLDNQEESAVKK